MGRLWKLLGCSLALAFNAICQYAIPSRKPPRGIRNSNEAGRWPRVFTGTKTGLSRNGSGNACPRLWLESGLDFYGGGTHYRQKRDGLWLPQHPFVQAVRDGSASRREFSVWVSRIYRITRIYGELLRAMCPPPPAGVWTDPWRDMEQLTELAAALGMEPAGMASSGTNPATRAVQIWLTQNLTNRSEHVAAQVCWALVEAMNPETGTYLAEGAARHYGLKASAAGIFQNRNEIQAARRSLRRQSPDADR